MSKIVCLIIIHVILYPFCLISPVRTCLNCASHFCVIFVFLGKHIQCETITHTYVYIHISRFCRCYSCHLWGTLDISMSAEEATNVSLVNLLLKFLRILRFFIQIFLDDPQLIEHQYKYRATTPSMLTPPSVLIKLFNL